MMVKNEKITNTITNNKYHVRCADIVNRCFKEAHSIPGYDFNNLEIIFPSTIIIDNLMLIFSLKEVLVSLRHREYGRVDQFRKRD